MSITLINPNLLVQRNDPLTTGIVYMPVALAYTAAGLRQAGFEVQVVDAFAANPTQVQRSEKFMILGLTSQQILEEIAADARVVFVYAINLTNHLSTVGIVAAVKKHRPDLPVVVLENTQAVTAYALEQVREEFFRAGADFILTGEADLRAVQLVRAILAGADAGQIKALDGVGSPAHWTPPADFIQDLDEIPFPAWDLFPYENYWGLRFAHGPQFSNRYLPLLTSRGCPYACGFCVVPATNRQRWRARSASNVVDEMAFWGERLGVHEFHFEDLDPTISDERIQEICDQIIKRGLQVTWKLVAGTKIETIRSDETLEKMARAGCQYISISPETGSPRVLKAMRKPFDLEHAVRMIHTMNRVGIRSQACFVLGYPGETDEDRQMTWDLVHDLTRNGVDEIAQFIITPVPGSSIYSGFEGYNSLSDLNFTPTWRDDYEKLSTFRLRLYAHFLWWKFRYHPLKILRQPFNFLRRRFETKMEMVPYRALVFKALDLGLWRK